ncbi:MAG: type II secretion system protein, partial [Gemmatimonadota bacterium]|nr:type II secretion system protein [Gemmatimonadota bacterium]
MRSEQQRRHCRGFTIIEMLVVMVVIGVLAGLGFARLQYTKDKATVASLSSDLHGIAQEQEAYYFQNRNYSPTIDSLNPNLTPGNVIVILEATGSGWSARASNPKVARQCWVVIG